MRAGLTKSQKAMLDAIRYLTVDGVAPTYDELAQHLGMKSRGHVSAQLVSLRDKGRITFARKARSIRIIEDDQPTEAALEAASATRLRGVIEQAAEALAAQVGQTGAADILARVLEKHRALAKAAGEEGAPRSRRHQSKAASSTGAA
jgi:SOS-response transcriptional repressor LexA